MIIIISKSSSNLKTVLAVCRVDSGLFQLRYVRIARPLVDVLEQFLHLSVFALDFAFDLLHLNM